MQSFGDDFFDFSTRRLSYQRSEVNLSVPESRCLYFFIQNKDREIMKKELMDYIWHEQGIVVSENSLNQVISSLRKSFEFIGLPKGLIVTIPKVGYQFNGKILHETLNNTQSPKKLDIEKNKTPCDLFTKKLTPTIFLIGLALCLSIYFILSITSSLPKKINYIQVDKSMTSSKMNFMIYYNTSLDEKTLKRHLVEIEESLLLSEYNPMDIKYLYINGAKQDYVVSYFLCKNDIHSKKPDCTSLVKVEGQ
ncbi:MAG: winged helix-turn-helix domain-containing protein [Aeromonas hydrophila]